MSPTTTRLSAEERRRSILEAAFPIFAKLGFHGTTTKELAWEAGVSEAMLYKHFKSKEAIYEALYEEHLQVEMSDPELQRILTQPPSTFGLCDGLNHLIWLVAGDGEVSIPFMMARSLLEDGRFASLMMGGLKNEGLSFITACLKAAKDNDDLVAELEHSQLALWLSHHLAFGFRLFFESEDVLDYPASRPQMVDQMTDFALRGLGLKQEAIERWRASLADE